MATQIKNVFISLIKSEFSMNWTTSFRLSWRVILELIVPAQNLLNCSHVPYSQKPSRTDFLDGRQSIIRFFRVLDCHQLFPRHGMDCWRNAGRIWHHSAQFCHRFVLNAHQQRLNPSNIKLESLRLGFFIVLPYSGIWGRILPRVNLRVFSGESLAGFHGFRNTYFGGF